MPLGMLNPTDFILGFNIIYSSSWHTYNFCIAVSTIVHQLSDCLPFSRQKLIICLNEILLLLLLLLMLQLLFK